MRLASTNAVSDAINSVYNKLKTDTDTSISTLESNISTLESNINNNIQNININIQKVNQRIDTLSSENGGNGDNSDSVDLSEINEAIAQRVNKTGDTMTGSLTITNGSFIGELSGNAATATILQIPRTINGTSFDGSQNITTSVWGTARDITIGNTTRSIDGSAAVSWTLKDIGAAAEDHTHEGLLTADLKYAASNSAGGSAISADKLTTARSINGTSFDGTSSITTEKWGSYRNFSISDATAENTGTTTSVDGAVDVSLSLPSKIVADIEGTATSATKLTTSNVGSATQPVYFNNGVPTPASTFLPTSGGTISGTLGVNGMAIFQGDIYANYIESKGDIYARGKAAVDGNLTVSGSIIGPSSIAMTGHTNTYCNGINLYSDTIRLKDKLIAAASGTANPVYILSTTGNPMGLECGFIRCTSVAATSYVACNYLESSSNYVQLNGKRIYLSSYDPGAVGAGHVWIQCG